MSTWLISKLFYWFSVWSITCEPRCFLIHVHIYLFNFFFFWVLFCCSDANSSFCAIERQCLSAHVPLCTYFMYEWLYSCPFIWIVFYTLPQHLSGQLSVQFVFVIFHFWVPSTSMPIDPWTSSLFLQRQNGFCCWKKNYPKTWSAFYDDCNRWKCFTTHFHSFVVINKIALNCIFSYFPLLF